MFLGWDTNQHDKEMTPSKYQVAIKEVYVKTNQNIIVAAGPGSGKSTLLLELLKATPSFKKTILTAFNKSIQEEISTKVPSHVKVSTLHSLGYSILRRNVSENFNVNKYKSFQIAKKALSLKNKKEKERDAYIFNLCKIVDLSRLNLVTDVRDIETLCDRYSISTINGEMEDAQKLMAAIDEYNDSTHKKFDIDFTDMLWLTYSKVKNVDFPKYDVVMTDELQDLNPLQKALVERIISPRGRFIGVGDERQTIYGFMGANLEALESFKSRPNTVTMPLSVTYRCGKAIVEEANNVFPGLEAYEENCLGEVRRGDLNEVEQGDFVVCRNNMPLISAWIRIVKQGKRANILGKEFGENLIVIIDKLAKHRDYKKASQAILQEKEQQLREKGHPRPTHSQSYQSLVEKLAIVDILKEEFGSFQTMREKVSEIYLDDISGAVLLSTIHKIKGREARRTFFLESGLIPSKYAETPTDLYQEECLRYVAITRAKESLIYVD
jgi:superfamily I DNA/RNA helicase